MEVFRLTEYEEHIFKRARKLNEKMIDLDLCRKWQVNVSTGYCQNQLTPSIVIFDSSMIGQENSPWKEIDLDYSLLSQLGLNQCYSLA